MKHTHKRSVLFAIATATLAFPAMTELASAQCVAGLGATAAQIGSQSWASSAPRTAGDYTAIQTATANGPNTIKFVQPTLIKDSFIFDTGLNKVFHVTDFYPSTGELKGGEALGPNGSIPIDAMNVAGDEWFLMSNNTLVAQLDVEESAAVKLDGKPVGFTYDGTYVWVAVDQALWQFSVPPADARTKVPTLVAKFQLPAKPTGELLFDGTAIWIPAGNSIFPFDTILDQAGPAFNLGGNITKMVFDGVYLWVSEGTNANVSEFDPLKGQTVNNFITPSYASSVAFDGSNLWVADSAISALYKVRACDASRSTVLPDTSFLKLGGPAATIYYDGTRKWVTYANLPTVSIR